MLSAKPQTKYMAAGELHGHLFGLWKLHLESHSICMKLAGSILGRLFGVTLCLNCANLGLPAYGAGHNPAMSDWSRHVDVDPVTR